MIYDYIGYVAIFQQHVRALMKLIIGVTMVKYNSESDFLQYDTNENGLFGGDGADRFYHENDIANQSPQSILNDIDETYSNGLFGGDGADRFSQEDSTEFKDGLFGGDGADQIANQAPQNITQDTESYKALYLDEMGDQALDFTQLSKFEVDSRNDLEEVSFHYDEGPPHEGYALVLDLSEDSIQEWSLGIETGDFA